MGRQRHGTADHLHLHTPFGVQAGQREAAEIGLMYYVARWYDTYLNHFTQPDTIIADPYNPMAWNRYAYANYNPIKYTDPTGHFVWIAVGAIIGAAISYGIQVYDNYDSGMSGSEAWTDVSIAEIVGGAIIGASVVALAPVAVAAAGDLVVGVGVTTGSTALIVAGNDAYGLSQTLTNFIYPISFADYPTLEIDSGSMPNIADNIQNAQNSGAPSILTRTTDA